MKKRLLSHEVTSATRRTASVWILFILLCAVSMQAQTNANHPGIAPSKTQAKKMSILTGFTPSPSVIYFHDVVYAHESDIDLHLQIVKPDTQAGVKLPCIIYIQGSAWFKQNCYAKIPVLSEFCKRGYVIASVEYRPSTTATYPAQIQDVKTAVRFMRKNAEKYNVDTANLFIWGDSSGGNMSLLEALTQDEPSLDTKDYGTTSLAVNAAVAFYPVTDVLRMQEFAPDYMDHISANSPTGTLFGHIPVMENPDKVKTASPIIYVSKDKASTTAPILIMTGNRDNVVPYEQSVIMADKLEECGYRYTFYKLEGADHGSWEFWTPKTLDIVDRFFKDNLKK